MKWSTFSEELVNEITQEQIKGIRLELAVIIEDAFNHAKLANYPSTDKLWQHVYAD